MQDLVRFGVSMPPELLGQFDALIKQKGYANRSEALRDLARNALVEQEWATGANEVAGTVTLIYNHHTAGLSDLLNDLQHSYHGAIIATLHVHLDADNCLEVLVVRGSATRTKEIADRLISLKGVIHGKLTITTTGKNL